jgi:trans-aconitate methyltransferase
MYEFIDTATKNTNFPPRMIRANDESVIDDEVYNEELLRLQRSKLHIIVARPVILQITDVLQWIATHVDFRRMAIILDEGKILGILIPNNLHNMYHLKPVGVKCNEEYLDRFYLANSKPWEVMKP